MVKVSLENLFLGKQEALKSSLCTNPITHCGERGNYSEDEWLHLFRQHLPNRYQVAKAFVIDCRNNLSDQLDIVIFDNIYSPFLFIYKDGVYIPAESVYAVFEVKQDLNKSNFEYAMNKIKSVRKLERTSASIFDIGKKTNGREPHTILGGLLTTTNPWSSCLTQQKVMPDDEGLLNLGCCANDCCWRYEEDHYEWCKNRDHYLLTFYMELLRKLQKMGTVPAMEIAEYFDGFSD